MNLRKQVNLNTILLAAILVILLMLASEFYRPNGIKEMLEGIYYTSNIFTTR